MAKQQKRYVITNTTVKAPRLDPKTNADLRPAIERVGHPVKFKDTTGREHHLGPESNPAIISEVNEGIIGLARGGYISIKEIDGVAAALQAHTLGGTRPQTPAAKRAAKAEKEAATEAPTQRVAKAVEMGQDNYDQKGGTEYEGAVNPDGNPNFLVRVPRGGPKGRRKAVSGESQAE